MPLSSVVGAQSIVRPGVCTSSTRPASPYDGQVIYETDTDLVRIWNGSTWVPQGSTIQQIQYYQSTSQVQFTSSTFVDVTNYSVTITPRSTSSLVRIDVTLNTRPQNANIIAKFQVLRGSTTTMQMEYHTLASGDYYQQLSGSYIDNPATTSATTYKLQGNTASGTQTINSGARTSSSIILTEYLP